MNFEFYLILGFESFSKRSTSEEKHKHNFYNFGNVWLCSLKKNSEDLAISNALLFLITCVENMNDAVIKNREHFVWQKK